MEKKFGQRIGWLSILIVGVFVASAFGDSEWYNWDSIPSGNNYGKTCGLGEYANFVGLGNNYLCIGSYGGQTNFNWGTVFGGKEVVEGDTSFNEDNRQSLYVDIVGGVNLFDHQNIKFGANYNTFVDGNSSDVFVNISGGVNSFTQRAIFGGVGGRDRDNGNSYDGSYTSGRAVVWFCGNSRTTFTHNWLNWPTDKYQGGLGSLENYNYHLCYNGAFFAALGNSETLSTEDTGKTLADYEDLKVGDRYNDASGYVRVKGVTFMNDKGEGATNKEEDCYVAVTTRTEGTTVTFEDRASTTFDVMAYFGGGYDLTTYGIINTSSDDNDVLFGGTNIVDFTGSSQTTFNARTFFGAGNSDTTVNFSGNSVTTFADRHQNGEQFWVTGAVDDQDWNQGYLLYHVSEALAKNPSFAGDGVNTYRGNDLPFVYFGGKTLTTEDQETFYYGQEDDAVMRDALYSYDAVGGAAVSKVTISDGASMNLYTSAFVGGADERWLAGDQYIIQADGTKKARFVWGDSADAHNTTGTTRAGTSAIRQDKGVGAMTLSSGTLKIGNVNTYAVLGSDPSTEEYSYDYMYNYQRNRYEQVRLIGKNATFDATGGQLTFKVSRYSQENAKEGSTSTLRDGSELLNDSFFNDLAENNGFTMNGDKVVITNTDGTTRDVNVLMTGLLAFDEINLGSGVDVNVSSLFQNGNIDWNGGEQEFFTNTALADTTEKNNSVIYDENNTSVELGEALANSRKGDEVNVAKTKYDYFAYTLTIEDSDEASDANRDLSVDSNQARLHIVVKDPSEIFKEGNLKDNQETVQDVLDNGPEEISDAIDNILSTAHTDDEAHRGFDELIGAPYSSMANDKIRRLTSMNNMLANQMSSNDVSRRPCQTTCCPDDGCGGCGGCGTGESCYQTRECHPWSAWANFYGDNSNVESRNGYTGYDTEYYGAMFAIEWNDCVGQHIGGYFNYGQTNANFDSRYGGTCIESDDYSFGLYAKWLGFVGGGYGTLIGNITWSNYESDRWYNPGSDYGIHSMNGDYNSILPTLYYEKGWVFFPGKNCTINPFVALQYAYYNAEAFSETGYDAIGDKSNLALNVGDITLHSLRTSMGLRLSRDFYIGANQDHMLTLRLDGAWIHELLDHTTPVVDTAHQGYTDYPIWHVSGNSAGRDWANIGFGLDFNICRRLKALIDYDCFFNESIVTHGGAATLRFEF
ncbi:MAG: autotransporter outer membrane beta-barrel domain-containing protein [Planctomycetia bacterium]|nr:autotransporter outer membrane beta-barrel domain-containing protein [Planctomycetia bacterium]